VPDIPRANHRTQGPKALLGSQQGNKVGGGRGRGQCIAYSKGDGWGRGNCLVLLTVAWANAKQNAIHIHLDEPCVALKLFVQ